MDRLRWVNQHTGWYYNLVLFTREAFFACDTFMVLLEFGDVVFNSYKISSLLRRYKLEEAG